MIRILLCASLGLTAGCANLMTIERATELPAGGRVVHLDAPQRVVLADKLGHICAEPSPDALQSYVSSLGLSVAGPSDRAVSIAGDLAGNAAGLGLRTQSITLMRDALFRICEAARNQKLTDIQVMQMLERSQDLSLGVLAIEQLTGAVVARQPMLLANARSSGNAKVASVKDALDRARSEAATAQDEFAKATAARDAQKDAVSAAQADEAVARRAAAELIKTVKSLNTDIKVKQEALDKANDTLAAERVKQAQKPGAEADKAVADAKKIRDDLQAALDAETASRDEYAKDARMVAYDKAAADLASQQEQLSDDEGAVKSAKGTADHAASRVTALETAPNSASAQAMANVVSSGSFSQAADRAFVNDKTVAALADATKFIVNTIVNKGHLTDTCAGILTSYAANQERADRIQGMIPLCREVFRANVEAYLARVRSTRDPSEGRTLLLPATLENRPLDLAPPTMTLMRPPG
jgi:hypothetical protein